MAWSISTIVMVSANALEDYLKVPHFVDFEDENIGLVTASLLIIFGLKACELCGNWKVERHCVQRIELCVVGTCLYGIAMGVLPPVVGDFWRYMVAFLVAVLVFNGSIWLDGQVTEQMADTVDEKVKKEVEQTA